MALRCDHHGLPVLEEHTGEGLDLGPSQGHSCTNRNLTEKSLANERDFKCNVF